MPKSKTSKPKGYTKADVDAVSHNPEWTKDDFAKARPFSDVFPEVASTIRKGRGPNKAPTKKLISLRLSPEVIERFQSTGPGWQARIDATLVKAAERLRDQSGAIKRSGQSTLTSKKRRA